MTARGSRGYFFFVTSLILSPVFSTALSTDFPAFSNGPSLHPHSPAISTAAANAAATLLLDFIMGLSFSNPGRLQQRVFGVCTLACRGPGELFGLRSQKQILTIRS